jgi:hypothetical protein
MSPLASDDNSVWLSHAARDASKLAIKAGFSDQVLKDLDVLREVADTFTETGFVDRKLVESCLERLRAAASLESIRDKVKLWVAPYDAAKLGAYLISSRENITPTSPAVQGI